MPPKSASKRPTSQKDTEINTVTLCDENWKCNVVFLYEGDTDGINFISLLSQIPSKQVTGGVKIINKSDVMKELKKGGGKTAKKGDSAKGKKDKSKDEAVELTDEQKIMKCIKENTPIPGAPLAGILKNQLMSLKVEDVNERRKQLAAFTNRKKSPESKKTKKSDKREKETRSDSEPIEETYVEPPPLFVILYGFNEYDLPLELIKLGVPMNAVVKPVKTEETGDTNADKLVTNTSSLESDKFNMSWLKFWRKFDQLMVTSGNADLGNDLAVIEHKLPQELMDTKVNLKDKKNIVMKQLTSMAEHIQSLLKDHEAYMKSLTVTKVSEMTEDPGSPDLYNTLMELVPLECVSIPVILFSIVEQVCHWHGDEIEVENESGEIDGFYKKQKCNYRLTKRHPALIRHNDEHTIKTFHLVIPEIDFSKIINRFLSKMYFFINRPKLDQMQQLHLDFHLQRLWKLSYRDINLKLFYMYLHWYILCKMKTYCIFNNKKNSEVIEIKSDDCANISDEIKFLDRWINDCGVLNQLSTKKKETSNRKLDKEIYSSNEEKLKPSINKLVELKPSELSPTSLDVTNTVIQDEFSSIREISKDYTTASSITKERNKNLDVLKRFLYCPEVICLCENDGLPKVSNLLKLFSDYRFVEEMTSESLLQAIQEAIFNYSQVQYVHYLPSNKTLLWFYNTNHSIHQACKSGCLSSVLGFRDYYKTTILSEPLQDKIENSTTENDVTNLTDKLSGDSVKNHSANHLNKSETTINHSTVYDLGKKKMLFKEYVKEFVSDDGSSVTVKVDDWYHSSQFINICINKIDIKMNIYLDILLLKSLDDGEEVDSPKTPIETMKVLVTFPNNILMTMKVEEVTGTVDGGAPKPSCFAYSDLTITLPTGLVVELVNNQLDDNDIYIKQYYTAKGPNCSEIWEEKCRCFTKYGTIIVFNLDNTIKVLHASSAVIKINNIIIDETIEEVIVPEVVVEKKKEKPKKENKKDKRKETNPPPKTPVKEEETVVKLPFKVTEHLVKTWSGITYCFKDGKLDEKEIFDNKVNLRTIFDGKSLYVDRNDGIKSLLSEDSSLVTSFNDGTLLTTSCYEESDCIELEANESGELVDSKTTDTNTKTFPQSMGYDITQYISTTDLPLEFEEKSDEHYVSYKFGCIAEHPNYVTVEFLPSDDTIMLRLPGDINLKIRNMQKNGTYNIKATHGGKAMLEFNQYSIDFQSNILKKSKLFNMTTISPLFLVDRTADIIYFCKTIDSYNIVFLVSKSGDTELHESVFGDKSQNEFRSLSSTNLSETEYYYENNIPTNLTEAFFVVNENFTGYEIINEKDIPLLEKEEEDRFRNVQAIKNPTRNRLQSKTTQHLIYKTHSDAYLTAYKNQFASILPTTFQRADLSPVWSVYQSPWLFIRTDKKTTFRQFSLTNLPKHNDASILAVVTKTTQNIADSNGYNGLEIILSCLKKYQSENDNICKKYKEQGFSDYDIDVKMKENYILTSSMRKEFPLWNILRKDCNICKQTFGYPTKSYSESEKSEKTSLKASTSVEKEVAKVNY